MRGRSSKQGSVWDTECTEPTLQGMQKWRVDEVSFNFSALVCTLEDADSEFGHCLGVGVVLWTVEASFLASTHLEPTTHLTSCFSKSIQVEKKERERRLLTVIEIPSPS